MAVRLRSRVSILRLLFSLVFIRERTAEHNIEWTYFPFLLLLIKRGMTMPRTRPAGRPMTTAPIRLMVIGSGMGVVGGGVVLGGGVVGAGACWISMFIYSVYPQLPFESCASIHICMVPDSPITGI